MFQQIHLVPNPSIFTVNDITIGVSAIDVLMHINSLQFLKRMPCSPDSSLESTSGYISATQSSDPMSLLARHILEQRRLVRWFYLYLKYPTLTVVFPSLASIQYILSLGNNQAALIWM